MGVAAKKGTRAGTASTAPREGRPGSGTASGKVLREDLLPNKVTGATALGGGYFIVHADTTARRTAPQPRREAVPGIEAEELRNVLDQLNKRFSPSQSTRIRAVKTNAPVTHVVGAAARTQKLTNQSFMAGMERDEARARQAQVEAGLLLPSSAMCDRMQISRAAWSKAVTAGRVFSLDGPSGTQLYPAFYANAMSNRRAQYRVSKALGQLPGALKWHFFTTPKQSLAGRTPLVAIEAGDVEAVMRAAAGYQERAVDR